MSDGSSVVAGHVVQATHMPFLNRGGAFARLVPSRAFALAGVLPPGGQAASTYTADDPTRSTRVVQREGQAWLIAVGEHHVVGRGGRTRTFAEGLAKWARDVFNVTEVGFAWSAQDLTSVDHLPMVGQVGSDPRILMASGFGGWGFTNAAAAADVLHAMVSRAQPSPWAADWDPRRTGLPGSLPGLVSSGAEVGGCFVGDRVRSLTGEGGSALAPGQAGVRRAGRRTIAGYRDHAGDLHEVDARCTHLGCLVRWNDADMSWDCPCHGSRFSISGDVIEGPAHTPLERIAP
jgi:Rieske Fe-S protein